MLYWAEGGKAQRMVRFSNGNPDMIQFMMRFFSVVCEVPADRFRGHIHIHAHLDHLAAGLYWSSLTGIPVEHFYKTYRRPSIYLEGGKNTLPHGVMDIYIMDVKLFLKLQGWIRGMAKG